ncbi:MAG: hypothetical protein V9G11_00320 [Bifidobacterium adolescentis]
MKKKALFIILVVVSLFLVALYLRKKYETMLNDGKTRNEEIGKAIEPADETNVSEEVDDIQDKDDSKEDNDASDNPQSVTREINFESIFHCSDQYDCCYLVETALMHILKLTEIETMTVLSYAI